MGMTMSLIGAVAALGGTWINTRIPVFGLLIAQRKWQELDALAIRATIAAVATALVTSAGALGVLWLLDIYYPAYAHRFLPVGTTVFFLGALLLQLVATVEGAYLRAFRREPMMVISLVTAFLVAFSTWQLGMRFGAHAVARGYFAIIALITFPVCTWILVCRRREWRDPASPAAEVPAMA